MLNSDKARQYFIKYFRCGCKFLIILERYKFTSSQGNKLSIEYLISSKFYGFALFLLFINDLPLVLKYCKADLFAVYATFHTHSKDNDTIEINIQSDFNDSKQWSKCNKMQVHNTKTSCMAVGTRQRLDGSQHLNIKSGDVSI